MRKFLLFVSAVAVGAISLGACSQQQEAPSGGSSGSTYLAQPSGEADVIVDGNTITATRTGEGRMGVVIRQAPMQVTFTVDDETAVIRARQGSQWIELPANRTNAIMIGRGGASQVRVESSEGDNVAVRITGVVDCNATACTPLAVPEEDRPAEEAEAAPTP